MSFLLRIHEYRFYVFLICDTPALALSKIFGQSTRPWYIGPAWCFPCSKFSNGNYQCCQHLQLYPRWLVGAKAFLKEKTATHHVGSHVVHKIFQGLDCHWPGQTVWFSILWILDKTLMLIRLAKKSIEPDMDGHDGSHAEEEPFHLPQRLAAFSDHCHLGVYHLRQTWWLGSCWWRKSVLQMNCSLSDLYSLILMNYICKSSLPSYSMM